jgi:hypothetical protein
MLLLYRTKGAESGAMAVYSSLLPRPLTDRLATLKLWLKLWLHHCIGYRRGTTASSYEPWEIGWWEGGRKRVMRQTRLVSRRQHRKNWRFWVRTTKRQ